VRCVPWAHPGHSVRCVQWAQPGHSVRCVPWAHSGHGVLCVRWAQPGHSVRYVPWAHSGHCAFCPVGTFWTQCALCPVGTTGQGLLCFMFYTTCVRIPARTSATAHMLLTTLVMPSPRTVQQIGPPQIPSKTQFAIH
jgi:hypothetical protein